MHTHATAGQGSKSCSLQTTCILAVCPATAALKLGSQRLANLVKRNPEQQQQQKQAEAEKTAEFPGDEQQGTNEVVARIRATAAG